MRIAAALFALVMFVTAPSALAVGGAPGPIVVTGPWITLGDVANASGPLAKVRVAPSPAPGDTLALDPTFVGKIARANGVFFPADANTPIMVARAGTASTPKAAPSAPARPNYQDAAPKEGYFLALVSAKQRGDILQADDLDWVEPTSSQRAVTGAPKFMSDLIGMEMRRTVQPNRALRTSDVKHPALIKKGEPVTLVYDAPGIKLTVNGKALADAYKNEPVRVMNLYSNRAIDAVATASGEARVLER